MRADTLERPAVCDCGHASTPTAGGGAAGYARTADGRTLCYPCADAAQLEEMRTADRYTAYISSDGRSVTTWTGGELGRVVSRREHVRRWTPTGGSYRPYGVLVRDAHGQLWTGRGSDTHSLVHLRRTR